MGDHRYSGKPTVKPYPLRTGVTLGLDQRTVDAIDAFAKAENVSFAAMCRRLIRDAISARTNGAANTHAVVTLNGSSQPTKEN